MRRVFFRGYDKIADTWCCGVPVADKDIKGRIWLMFNENEGVIIDDTNSIGQYTGLKDKNGKEIYEGDIVETTFFLHSQPNLKLMQIVKFEKGCFVLNPLVDNTELEFETTYQYTYLHVADKINVIDNIHENKKNLTISRV